MFSLMKEKIVLISAFDKIFSLDLLRFDHHDDNCIDSHKDWATADKIREELAVMHISISDTKDGTTWTVIQENKLQW
jgi:cysteinyl-tRNA synthetase